MHTDTHSKGTAGGYCTEKARTCTAATVYPATPALTHKKHEQSKWGT